MSLDVSGFKEEVRGGKIIIKVDDKHPLLNLANNLPWQSILKTISSDIKSTAKGQWHRGRPLRLRIHLGAYILQQIFDLKDREVERQMRENAVYQLFCGRSIVDKWHCPDHTKIAAFRNRLLPETHRLLANLITQHAAKTGFAKPEELDIDGTIQESHVKYPTLGRLMKDVAVVAHRIAKALNKYCYPQKTFKVNLAEINYQMLQSYTIKRSKRRREAEYKVSQKRLWEVVYENIIPIYNNVHKLLKRIQKPKHWNLKRDVELLSWRGMTAMEEIYRCLFEEGDMPVIRSLYSYDVQFFNKKKLNKTIQYGRQYQLGRIGGNFLFVGACINPIMSDARSYSQMIRNHQHLFGIGTLGSVATDKGYHSYDNEAFAKKCRIEHVYLPRPASIVTETKSALTPEKRTELHNRRAGIEPVIGHTKQSGQLKKSRMKSDLTTLAAGYRAVLGFNLRQLIRYITGGAKRIAA